MSLPNITFNPEVWGSVSDWSMVIVTIITAYYLYKTLQSQKDVQQLQSKLFEMEHMRFRESIKPNLNYTASDSLFTPTSGADRILTFYVTNESEGMALGISKMLQTDGKVSHQVFIPTGIADSRKHLAKGDQPLMFHFKISNPHHGFVCFAITYKDIAGTEYKQSIFCHCDRHGIEVHRFLPEVID